VVVEEDRLVLSLELLAARGVVVVIIMSVTHHLAVLVILHLLIPLKVMLVHMAVPIHQAQ
jgi:hypothetical protein